MLDKKFIAIAALVVVLGFLIGRRMANNQPTSGAAPQERLAPGVKQKPQSAVLIAETQELRDSFSQLSSIVRSRLNVRDYLAAEDALAKLTAVSPERALEFAKTLPKSSQFRAFTIILAAWMRSDPSAAVSWALENSADFFRTPEFAAECVRARRFDLVERALGGLQDDSGKNFILQRLTHEWAKVDPVAVTEWAKGLPALGFKDPAQAYALAGIVESLASETPDLAATWIEQNASDDNSKRRYYQALVKGILSGQSVAAAEDYFRERPFVPTYNLAYSSIVEALARSAPERIDYWFDKMTDVSARRAALTVPILRLTESHPDIAVHLIEAYDSTLDPDRSSKAFKSAVLAWYTRDSVSARQFIERSTRLSAIGKEELRAMMPPEK